jgi:DNA polymerase-1
LDLKVKIEDLSWLGFDSNLMSNFFEKMEIRALKERLKSLPQAGGAVAKEVSIKVSEVTAEEISKLIEKHAKPIAVAFDYVEEALLGYSVATSETEVFYVQSSKMGDWISKPEIAKHVHSAKIALKNLGLSGVKSDIELLAYLCNPGSRNLSLSDLAERILGEVANSEDLFSQFDPKQAAWIFALEKELSSEVKSKGMLSLYEDLEQPTLVLLSQIEEIGIAVDQEKLNQLSSHFTKIVADETAMAYKEAGHEFNVSSPKQLQVVLFDELKLPKTKKIKTGFTTDAESLEWLAGKTKHPLLKHLLRIRETSKLMTTIDGLISAVESDGRIHTNFQQTVAATGRLSSTDPNLQNIPIRTEEGRKIRDCFTAQKPYLDLLTADYSQIEMRIMAHLSDDKGLISAFESGEDLHSTVASQVFNVKKNEVDAEMRRTIKAMSYGLAYGLSSFGLAQQLDIDPASASELMGKYFERFGGIRDYLKTVVEQARELGYTQTILGRRRYLPDLNHENRQRREIAERAALNAPIQGSAADIIKIAMLKVDSKIKSENLRSRLLLQVHDELILEVSPGEHETLSKIVKEQMSNAYELNVPLDVNIGVGKSWDLAAH